MTAAVIGVGIAALVLMMLTEGIASEMQRRKANTGTVLVAGLLGIAYFVGMLLAFGAL